MGIWNAHTSVGNIMGSLLSGAALSTGMHGNDWPMAFYLSGGLISCMGLIVCCILPNKPEDVGLPSLAEEERRERMALLQSSTGSYGSDGWEKAKIASSSSNMDYGTTSMTVPTTDGSMDGRMDASVDASMGQQHQQRRYHSASDDVISFASAPKSTETTERRAKEKSDRQACCGSCSFCRALGIPGVLEFAMSLFFAKFVAYMFIYWLPYYLGHLKFSTDEAANISSYFDLGGILGGILAGWSSDKLGRRAPVAFVYLILSIPALYFYRQISASVGDSSLGINIAIMIVCGAFVNGPYALITTAVSADLGAHPSLKGDLTLTATVTGIIDGTGSIGASVQGVLIGLVASGCTATGQSWDAVFNLLMICCAMSGLCLVRLVWRKGPDDRKSFWSSLYRLIVIFLMLGMVAVAVYCGTALFQSCAGTEPCQQY